MTPDRSAEKSLGILRPKLDAPKADRFVADRNTPFGEHVFDISVAEIESMIQPDGVANDAVHRKNNHPKRAGRQVRLEIEGLDWNLCGRPQTGISKVAKRLNAARTGFTGLRSQEGLRRSFARRARPYLEVSGCPVRNGGARGCDALASFRARMCSRIVAMRSGSSMQAMTRSVPPHLGQVSIGPRSDQWRKRASDVASTPWAPAAGRASMLRVRGSARCVPGATARYYAVRLEQFGEVEAVVRQPVQREAPRAATGAGAHRSGVPEGAIHELTWGYHPNALATVAGEVLQVAGHQKLGLCRQCHFKERFVIGVREPGLERLACGNLAPGANLRQERRDFRCLERKLRTSQHFIVLGDDPHVVAESQPTGGDQRDDDAGWVKRRQQT